MRTLSRRGFLREAAGVWITARTRRAPAGDAEPAVPKFSTQDEHWQATYDRALAVLAANVRVLPHFENPVLMEGGAYAGVWQECAPHEGLVYGPFRPDVARNNHLTFFDLQRNDGQLPANNKTTEIGFGQIQMVVPIAATAWELAQATGDEQLLHKAYEGCSRWDKWLVRYRNTRGTGLIEGFCAYDTGHDNSPRWAGIPNRCPNADARICPPDHGLPRLCPDLSATVYGGRVAPAAMAKALGKPTEEEQWSESAQKIRNLILAKLFVETDGAFYDLDANGQFVRVRSDVLSRGCGEHVVTPQNFESIWQRQLHNRKAFWAPYPLPSIALDDPTFVRPIPRNSWGGASQALTALRAPRWLEYYGKPAELAFLMDRWCRAIRRDSGFRQQLDPVAGEFTQADAPTYSPAALVFLDFTWRLAGVRADSQALQWNVRPGYGAACNVQFSIPFDRTRSARMQYEGSGARLVIDGREIGRVTSGVGRLITDWRGRFDTIVGVSEQVGDVGLVLPGRRPRNFHIGPNEKRTISHEEIP